MNRLEKLTLLVKPYYEKNTDPAHDWSHIERVVKNGEILCQFESLDTELTKAAILCHDLVNLAKDHPDRSKASEYSAKVAKPLLINAGFLENEIEQISLGIIQHSFSRGERPDSMIAKIVQDADRLDALGAIGILRCAITSAKLQSTLYSSIDPFGSERELNDKKFMLDHYSKKLFLLPELMNTDSGKRIANERVSFMKDFLQQFSKEINLCG